jgi:protein SCO1/2
MTDSASRVAVIALGALLLAVPAVASQSGMHGLRVEPPKEIRSEALVDHDGRKTRFPLTVGAWQLAFFGYTHCPDVCPITLHKAQMLLDQLGPQAPRLQVLFLSIDTTRDNPEQVRQFVARHDARIKGLTGDAEAMQAVANEFGVLTRRFQGKTALAYTLEHSSFLYLLDPQGRVRVMYPATVDLQDIARDLRQLWRAPAG